MHEIVSSTLKKTLSARLQPVSFEIINLLLLLFNDDDVDVLAIGVFVLELELDYKKEKSSISTHTYIKRNSSANGKHLRGLCNFID